MRMLSNKLSNKLAKTAMTTQSAMKATIGSREDSTYHWGIGRIENYARVLKRPFPDRNDQTSPPENAR